MSPIVYTLDGEPLDIESFFANNAETLDDNETAAICALQAGESLNLGGGASATSVLKRES